MKTLNKSIIISFCLSCMFFTCKAHPEDKYLEYEHYRQETAEFTVTVGHKSKGTEKTITIKNGESRYYWKYNVGNIYTFYIDDNNNTNNEFVTGTDWTKMMNNTTEV